MKTHLITSETPLPYNEDQVALCGAKVEKAFFVFQFEDGPNGVRGMSTLLFCSKCALAPMSDERYLYGMIPGEQALRMESANADL